MSERLDIKVTVNGESREGSVEPRRLLADFLREDLGLTGTHLGCEHGVCGACTVLLDGDPVRSCLMLAAQADGAEVRTVEGLAANGELHPLQKAFHEHHALQCGYCTPGFLTTGVALLEQRPDADDDEVRRELSGVLCRCTGYQNIVTAALAARDQMKSGG
jgi:aerobic-type carbon monoxide dehydrogenase small subunit (CoxS/CutS family)